MTATYWGRRYLATAQVCPVSGVLFSILVGGGLFGFIGMVIGIPVFAVIYAYLSRAVNSRLRKRGFSTDLSDYKSDSYRLKRDGNKGLLKIKTKGEK